MFTIREAECLGACGSAPVLQVSNRAYVHNATPHKCDKLVANLREGTVPGFVGVTLPQDEDDAELKGNRRSDADATDTYQAPPVSETLV